MWSDRYEAHNQQLLERQQVLRTAWQKTVAEKSGGDDFLAFWTPRRAAALRAAGMDPVWEN